MVPPNFGAVSKANPKTKAPQIIISVPQNQFRHKRFLEEFAKTEIPVNSSKPENKNIKIPNIRENSYKVYDQGKYTYYSSM